jgi:hypothetical protein
MRPLAEIAAQGRFCGRIPMDRVIASSSAIHNRAALARKAEPTEALVFTGLCGWLR